MRAGIIYSGESRARIRQYCLDNITPSERKAETDEEKAARAFGVFAESRRKEIDAEGTLPALRDWLADGGLPVASREQEIITPLTGWGLPTKTRREKKLAVSGWYWFLACRYYDLFAESGLVGWA